MPRKQKKYHYIYKTTNILNGKYYIGMHSTNNLEDGYVGSGTKLWYSINKHGLENHHCEILEFLDDRFSLANREKEIVNEDLLKDPMCMNLKFGGEGGFPPSCHGIHDDDHYQKFAVEGGRKGGKGGGSAKRWKQAGSEKLRKVLSDSAKRLHAEGKIKNAFFEGKKHTDETKKVIGEKNSAHQTGEGNSQFGKCWIHNLEQKQSKSVPKSEVESWLNTGWILGRKMRFE